MRVALAQMSTVAAQLDVTVERMVAQSRLAAGQGAGLVVFPAPALVGPDVTGLAECEEFLLDVSSALADLAPRLACPAIVPVATQVGEAPVYEAVFVNDGKAVPLRLASAMAAGRSLADQVAEGPLDASAMARLAEPVGFSLAGVAFGVAFDRDGLEDLKDSPASLDAVLYLPATCFSTDDEESALAPAVSCGAFVRDASDLNAWLVCVGGVGGYDDRVFAGGSFVLAPWGELAAALPSFEEAFQVVDVDTASEGPLAQPLEPPAYRRVELLWDALVTCVRDLAHAPGGEPADLLVPLEGDLPSAVAAAVALDAVGPTRLHALVVDAGDAAALADARAQAAALRCEVRELGHAQVARAQAALGLPAPDREAVRAQAAAVLSAWARECEGIVLGTEDKTAIALEGPRVPGADVAPLGDVYRSDVIALALHRMGASPVVPASAAARYDVPDLPGIGFAGITREARLGGADAMLLLAVEEGMSLTEVAEREGNPRLATAVLGRLRDLELARRHAPLVPIVSGMTLAEVGWPVRAAWRDHVRDQAEYDRADEAHERLARMAQDMADASPTPDAEGQVAQVMELLRDMLSQGGMSSDGRFESGLFSEN